MCMFGLGLDILFIYSTDESSLFAIILYEEGTSHRGYLSTTTAVRFKKEVNFN